MNPLFVFQHCSQFRQYHHCGPVNHNQRNSLDITQHSFASVGADKVTLKTDLQLFISSRKHFTTWKST